MNDRLIGSPSEDPVYPKIHFPRPAECPGCYDLLIGRKQTADFLVAMYADVVDDGVAMSGGDLSDSAVAFSLLISAVLSLTM